MSVDHVRFVFLKRTVQPAVDAVIESRMLAQIADLDSRILQHVVEVAADSSGKGDDDRFVTPAVQSPRDVHDNALGAAGTQHGDNLHYFDFVHEFNLPVWTRKLFRRKVAIQVSGHKFRFP